MASVDSEYERFLIYLQQLVVDDDVRRFAHLVLVHLRSLAEVGAARSIDTPNAAGGSASGPVTSRPAARSSRSGPRPSARSPAPPRGWTVPGIHAAGDVRP